MAIALNSAINYANQCYRGKDEAIAIHIKHTFIEVLGTTLKCLVLFDKDRLCGLVVRVSGYRYRGLGFDSRRYQIF